MGNPLKMKCKVTHISKSGDGVYSIELGPEGRLPRFKPGQFLHLSVDDYDPAGGFWPESRVFSIASRYGSSALRIVYSVKGKYTRLMEERLREGGEVWVKLPFGDFIIDAIAKAECDAVLVAGGTGVSPFVPFIEGLEAGQRTGRTRLFYGVRKAEHLLFGDVIASKAADGLLDARVYVEEGAVPSIALPCERGRLDMRRILSECADMREPAIFLSGPPAMISAFKAALLESGVPAGRIHIDEWE